MRRRDGLPDVAAYESGAGLLMIEPPLKPLYANAQAIQILAYPEDPRNIKSLDSFLASKIQSELLHDRSSPQPAFVTEYTSGRRHYLCRVFSLDAHSRTPGDRSTLVLLLERNGKTHFDGAVAAARFRLTPREVETLHFLVQGFTNKEIAGRMKISTNTVKAFLKIIMIKTGASTRSGIVGKVLNPRP